MIAAAPLTFPGGRAVAGWWRELLPFHTRALWIAHLLLHRIEALVRTTQPRALDPFLVPVLEGLAQAGSLSVEGLDQRLHLGRQFVGQLLRGLQREGLAASDPDGRWTLTEAGRAAPRQGEYTAECHERATFYFVESSYPDRPPSFLSLGPASRPSWPAGSACNFDVAQLEACVRRPADWKTRRAFPDAIAEVLGSQPGRDVVPDWRRTIVDYPERLSAVLILAPSETGQDRCLAFEFQQQGWHLQAESPVFALDAEWSDVLPELAEEVPVESWRQSWQAWLQSRGLVNVDVESCRFEPGGLRLGIALAPGLMDRLRAVVRPAVLEDIWLLAGEGRFRAAAHVELIPTR
jgi:hypothetical protein